MAAAQCEVARPGSPERLQESIAAGGAWISRGLGRSYGDQAVNGGGRVLDLSCLDCLIGFDAESGVVECEAGVSLETLINVFLPRGYFLPVTPGTKYVTVGGAIANDVHGKNHHAVGSFGNFVESLQLLTPEGGILACSPSENAAVYWATLGGGGLTGAILSARIRLQPVETGYLTVDYERCANLDDVLARAHDGDDRYQYSVAWIDCLAKGGALGRSVLMRGNHTALSDLPPKLTAQPYPTTGRQLGIPFDFPGFALNAASVKAFNEAFYLRHATRSGVIAGWNAYFYPLDQITRWNRMYGKRGFAQYQATFPSESAAGIARMLERLSATRRASFLAVIKRMGPPNAGLLSHPIEGYTLNLDLPNSPGLVPFLHELDGILLDHGGRLYFAKDVCAKAETIAEMYPRLDEFRALRAGLDPRHRITSDLARRLKLVETNQ
jgi:FAD/FMN-containing dehydrogenase